MFIPLPSSPFSGRAFTTSSPATIHHREGTFRGKLYLCVQAIAQDVVQIDGTKNNRKWTIKQNYREVVFHRV